MQHHRIPVFKRMRSALWDPGVRYLLMATISMIIVGAIVYHEVEGWRWIDAIYFSVITIATVGYGDFTPQTDIGKIFTIVYVFCGLGLFVTTATAFADHIINGPDGAYKPGSSHHDAAHHDAPKKTGDKA